MAEVFSIRIAPSFTSWRQQARELLAFSINPDSVLWSDESEAQTDLFGDSEKIELSGVRREIKITKAFLDQAKTAACHSTPTRWALLYKIAWRMVCNGERHLLNMPADPDTQTLQEMVKAIRRDCHKMNAFVRFRKVSEDKETGREQFVAWFEPSHHIIEYNAQFFVRRFTGMDWSILSPSQCIHWDGKKLHVTEGVSKDAAPDGDELEELWLGYYKSIFNPARLKLKAMQAEMPKKYWKNLPEAALIEELSREASERTDSMIEAAPVTPRSAPNTPYLKKLWQGNEPDIVSNVKADLEYEDKSVSDLADLAAGCRACPLWESATQTVFGVGMTEPLLRPFTPPIYYVVERTEKLVWMLLLPI